MNFIPFNKPFIVGKELFYIAQAVIENRHTAGDGPFTKKCQAWLEEHLGCRKALLTHSCTAALEMAAILADIQPGDEVIMPSFTFVSTANAFVLRGGVPVFVDIRPDTLNIDETLIEAAITPQDPGDLPVHYAGVACEMETIMDDRRTKHDLLVIEDAAQALLSHYKDALHGHHRPSGLPELPRDQEHHLRRGRRTVDQRSAALSNAPRSSARRAPTAASSSAAKWTNTPGWIWAHPTCPAKSSPPSSLPRWRTPNRS